MQEIRDIREVSEMKIENEKNKIYREVIKWDVMIGLKKR